MDKVLFSSATGVWAHIAGKKKGYPGTFKPGNEIGKEYRFKRAVRGENV